MARNRSRRQRERSARFWVGLGKFALFLGMIGATGFYAYEVGMQLSANEIEDLRTEMAKLSASERDARAQAAQLRSQLAMARDEADTFRVRYEELAPDEMQAIITRAQAKLSDGLAPGRLIFAIDQAREPRDCSPAENRRFIARTDNYDGANTTVRFNDLVTVGGTGVAAEEGRAQWFDPVQDVTMTFTPLGGNTQEVSGQLPVQHAMVFKGMEYRFTAAPGPQGFIEVTADWCPYGS